MLYNINNQHLQVYVQPADVELTLHARKYTRVCVHYIHLTTPHVHTYVHTGTQCHASLVPKLLFPFLFVVVEKGFSAATTNKNGEKRFGNEIMPYIKFISYLVA